MLSQHCGYWWPAALACFSTRPSVASVENAPMHLQLVMGDRRAKGCQLWIHGGKMTIYGSRHGVVAALLPGTWFCYQLIASWLQKNQATRQSHLVTVTGLSVDLFLSFRRSTVYLQTVERLEIKNKSTDGPVTVTKSHLHDWPIIITRSFCFRSLRRKEMRIGLTNCEGYLYMMNHYHFTQKASILEVRYLLRLWYWSFMTWLSTVECCYNAVWFITIHVWHRTLWWQWWL